MGFTQAGAAIKEQRVVRAAGVIRNLTRRRASQLVGFTFDEVIKRMFDVDVRAVGRFCRRRNVIQPGRTIVGATRAVWICCAGAAAATLTVPLCI